MAKERLAWKYSNSWWAGEMSWNLVHHHRWAIIELILTGEQTQQDFVEAATARVKLGKETGVSRFIINPVDLVASRDQAFDVVSIPATVYAKNQADPSSAVALLQSPDKATRELVKFYETAALNRGWLVRIFEDRECAIQWLLGVKVQSAT